VRSAAAELGVAVAPGQAERMGRMAAELLVWNRRVNLTAITDPRDVALKHFVDSLAGADLLPAGARVLDVGTGAGFPGLPLKILRPDLRLTLIDGVRKKTAFVAHVIRLLGLAQTEALHLRLEALGRAASRPSFDAVVGRAVAVLARWVPAAVAVLAPGGMLLAYKGPRADEEIAELPCLPGLASHERLVAGRRLKVRVHPYRLPVLGDGRTLVQFQDAPRCR
jgi:16S rRNA (guanine527-N7)-methyltransferase